MSAKKATKKGRGPAAKRVETVPVILRPGAGALTQRQVAVILGIGFAFGVGVLDEWGQLNGLATIVTVDVSGLLRGETARVWLFLQPLVVVPVALELSRVLWPWRIAIFAMQWWLLVVIKAKMSFVEP